MRVIFTRPTCQLSIARLSQRPGGVLETRGSGFHPGKAQPSRARAGRGAFRRESFDAVNGIARTTPAREPFLCRGRSSILAPVSDALVPFGSGIWIADGPVVDFYGFPYSTRMVLIRLQNGDLFVWSPVSLTGPLKNAVDGIGRVAYLVSPNSLHHLSLAEWKASYPHAAICGSRTLAKKRSDLKFDVILNVTQEVPWSAEVEQVEMAGSFALTETVFFHRNSRTALFADLIENFAPDWFSGWRGWVARLDGIVAPQGGAPREWRLTFLRRKEARSALNRILAWQPEKAVVAHGASIRHDATTFIERSFRWLR
ncbi:MAG TPA: DUF4336 domain-containing protein [Rhizomicrobium sp.]|jgi:hypothetical protein